MSGQKAAWYISNISPSRTKKNQNSFITNIQATPSRNDKNLLVFIDGYIIPRYSAYDEYKSLSQPELIFNLYVKHGLVFIHHIKGIFNIILFNGEKFYVFNDRHGIKKYFLYQKGSRFILSNSLKFISDTVALTLSKENIAVYCLLDHFVEGMSLFNEVTSSKPASFLSFENELNIKNYWQPQELLQQTIYEGSFQSLAINWKAIIGNYIEYLKPRKITLTLTGGNDSRMVLAGLLSNGIQPNTFTFGNPESADGVIAQQVARKLELEHSNHFVSVPSNEWFGEFGEKIIGLGNSLVNIHRAHRMHAIENEKNNHYDTDMVFTGLVGGEYIKEPSYNNTTIPSMFEWLNKSENTEFKLQKLESNLAIVGFNVSQIDVSLVNEKMDLILAYANGLNEKQKKFIYTYYYYAVAHHAQDPIIYGDYIDYVVNPFMDVDFLELLASYPGWYVNKKTTPIDKIWHSYFIVKMTDVLCRKLSEIPFAKKGQYTGKELLHRPIFYLIKRGINFIRNDREEYPRNFPMGQWLYDFSKDQLGKIHPEIKALFDYDFLKNTLESIRNEPSEETWHVVTNPINLSMNLEYYEKV